MWCCGSSVAQVVVPGRENVYSENIGNVSYVNHESYSDDGDSGLGQQLDSNAPIPAVTDRSGNNNPFRPEETHDAGDPSVVATTGTTANVVKPSNEDPVFGRYRSSDAFKQLDTTSALESGRSYRNAEDSVGRFDSK
ncbi:hypothetical protein HOH87_06010 [bacterium]|nr:hypothetical protein [bacterium]